MTFSIEYKDGRVIEYADLHRQRVLYAITSLEMTPIINDIGIKYVRTDAGQVLWPPGSPR